MTHSKLELNQVSLQTSQLPVIHREQSSHKSKKVTTSTLKKWGFLFYFFVTGFGLFWVISFGSTELTVQN